MENRRRFSRASLLPLLVLAALPVAAAAADESPAPDSSYWSGTVAGYPAFLYLEASGGAADGWYRYNTGSGTIVLSGTLGGDGVLVLRSADGAERFEGVLEEARFEGEWTAGRTTAPFAFAKAAQTAVLSVRSGPALDVAAAFPLIQNPDALAAPGADIRDYVADTLSDLLESAAYRIGMATDPDETSYPPYTVSAEIGYEIPFVGERYLSVLLSWWEYTGGAHGNYGKVAFAYERNAGGTFVPIALKDLLKPGGAALDALTRLVLDDLRTQGAGSVVSGGIADFGPDGPRVFAIAPGGLVFYFAPYEVGSYAAGAYEVTVPWDRMRPLLDDRAAAALTEERLLR